MGEAEHVAAGYREFAAREAARRSLLYAEWAAGVARGDEILSGVWPEGGDHGAGMRRL